MDGSRPFAELSYHELVYMKAPTIPVSHAFTTRWGGVSEGSLDSLNLGENRGDSEENVRENYRRLFEALELPGETACFTKQVHGNTVKIVTGADRRAPFEPFLFEADGIVTGEKGLPLFCFTADCIPVLLCDSKAAVIGAVHCGWRSTVADILAVAIEEMQELGASPENICAAIGPGIDFCCYETGADVAEGVEALLGGDCEGVFFPIGEGKFMVDLKEANKRRLLQLGLKEKNISVSDECTACNSDKYWSHRITKGERGSQAAVITLS